MKDWQKFALLLALIAVLAWLLRRKPLLTQTSSTVVGASISPAAGSLIGPIQDEMNQMFQRICAYEAGARLNWPFLSQSCPPSYAGSPLTSDTLEPKL